MPDTSFRSGSVAIPAGVMDFRVPLSMLGFTPASAIVSVRTPNADAPFVTAIVVGTIEESGFSVALTAEVGEGYKLDYTVFSDGIIIPVAGDTLAANYDDLFKTVSRFLGYDSTALTDAQTEEVDSYIQSGIRNFYYPPKTAEGVDVDFEWSFTHQHGSIVTEAGEGSYMLPNGFGRIAGQIAIEGEYGPQIPIIPYGSVMALRQRETKGRPRYAAYTSEQAYGSKGQLKKLYLYPTPDKAYTLSFECDADTGKIDAVNRPFPLGGAMFAELIKESCLAVAEQMANDEEGLHTKKFTELLISSIQRDRKSSAQNFGNLGDPECHAWD